LRGDLYLTIEEGTWAAWLYDLLKPRVTNIVVCDPRRNALLQEGNQNDRVDARKLSELLCANLLRPIYHGENGLRTLTRSFSRANKRGKNFSPRARSTRPGNCFVPFWPWVRSARPC
jgi:hypothetical protein